MTSSVQTTNKHLYQQKAELLVLCQLFYPELVSTGQTLTELCEELVRIGVNVEVVCGPQTILNRDQKTQKIIDHKGIRIRRVWGTRFPKLESLRNNELAYINSIIK